MISVIFIGDIIGKIGRRAVVQHLPELLTQTSAQAVIANVENLSHGIGFTRETLAEVLAAGVSLGTGGNHSWTKAGADEILNDTKSLIIRPYNYSGDRAGVGYRQIDLSGLTIGIANVSGQVFMNDEAITSPFVAIDEIIEAHPEDMIIVDFHGEATSEKIAFAHYVDGRVAAVCGTHTHVPTADARILRRGTALVTDVGMVGYHDSVIGADPDQVLNGFLARGKSSKKHDVPETGECQFNSVILTLDPTTRRAVTIERHDAILKVA